ncbi:FecR family protein [Cyclobacterium xiamenense]|uniref:FecR family protein n=1 Tax=Cyclobacterium xiamenense TaxID=1297121 RepID=UPI0012B977E2|nr:FecR family protein [Cyclobacterium xiamenense]
MKYSEYDIVDFLMDEFFIQWIKNPNQNNCHFWEKWIRENPDKRAIVLKAASLIRSVKYREEPEIGNAAYVEIFENSIKSDNDNCEDTSAKEKSLPFFKFKNMVALILFGFCASMIYVQIFYEAGTVASSEINEEWITRAVPKGKKSIVTLSDGTRVFLNAESELTYPKNHSGEQRWAKLKGEAFFEVKKDPKRFRVLTKGSEIDVLGTSFNVKEEGQGLEIALVSGKVRVRNSQGNQVELAPLEMVKVDASGISEKRGFDLLAITGWKDRILVFQSDNLEQVVGKLEKWYGIDLVFSGKVSDHWNYSGTYHNENLENVLKGISLTSGLRYRIEENRVLLYNDNQ